MLVAKIQGKAVTVHESGTNAFVQRIDQAAHKGATSAQIQGDEIAITCGDGKVRVYHIKTGGFISQS